MFEAARFDDEIAHSNALLGFLAGAVLGVVLVAAASIFVVATCGAGAILLPMLIGVVAGLAGSELIKAGESIGRATKAPAGGISSGSRNVFINGLKAAVVQESVGLCKKHPVPPMVAEGSSKVFINGLPAARKGDKLTCGSVIDSGSENVFIGAEKEQYLEVDDEVPKIVRNTVDILMIVASFTGAIRQLPLAAGKFLPCALKFAAGAVTGELISRYAIGPAISRVAGGLFGNPVDAVNGRKLLLEETETDFSLPGLMPIAWARFYASDITHAGALGRGWVLPWEQSLRLEGRQLYLRDNQGRDLPLPALEPGERLYLTDEQMFVVRSEGGHYLLQSLDNTFFYFADVADNGQPSPLRRIENALGHFLNFSYDSQQRLRDLCASGGIRLHLCYEQFEQRLSRVERVVDNRAVETLVHYQYDANGQLRQVINRNGDRVRSFAYNQGLMVTHENGLGLQCHYRWETLDDGQPRVAEHWTNDGERYRLSYNLAQRQTWIKDVLGRVARIDYNASRRVIASTDFGGEAYRFELDDAGNMTGLELPDGNALSFAYDRFSRLTEETDPLGRPLRYSYHLDTDLITAIERADGSCQRWTYDSHGNLLDSTDPLGRVTQFFNTDAGLPHTRIDPQGNRTRLWWNSLGQIERYQDCSGQFTHYAYDAQLHLVSITDALQHSTRLTRKADGEVLRIDHPTGSQERYRYNALGQLLSHTNADGHTTSLTRTLRGLPSQRKDPCGRTVRYHYDNALRLVGLQNENHAMYRFSYDASDRLQEEERIDGLRRRFSYSVSGQLRQLEEIATSTTLIETTRQQQFEHDAAGRLLSRVTSDARLDYHYDEADRLIAIERLPSAAGAALGIRPDRLAFSYDAADQLLSESSSTGNLAYHYDELGNLTGLELPDARQLNQLYYGSGHLHQINLDGQLISDVERDALYRETLRTQGALTSRFGYDSEGRKIWQSAIQLPHEQLSQLHEEANTLLGLPEHPATMLFRRYHYSPGGEVQRITDKRRGITDFNYDASGQLRSRQPSHSPNHLSQPQRHTEDFSYDPAGNLNGSGSEHFDNTPDNRLKAFDDLRFSYDAWGNLSEKSRVGEGMQRFTYDSENRLIQAQTWHGATLYNQAHYHYDALGRRIEKQVTYYPRGNPQTKKTTFLWQGLRLLQEQQPQRHSTYAYEPDSYAPLARIDHDPTRPEQPGQVYYFHNDQIGTPQEMTNAEGQVVWRAYYKAWGGLEALTQNPEQNLRFQGQYHDRETGLYYNTFRYYDPAVGRFTTQDPIGLMGGINLYQYAPNALGWVDPWGLACGPKWKSRRSFKDGDSGLKDHARRHSNLSPEQYLERGKQNILKGKALKGGGRSPDVKYYVRKVGDDAYSVTIADKSNQILSIDTWKKGGESMTKIDIMKGLKSSGITPPQNFWSAL